MLNIALLRILHLNKYNTFKGGALLKTMIFLCRCVPSPSLNLLPWLRACTLLSDSSLYFEPHLHSTFRSPASFCMDDVPIGYEALPVVNLPGQVYSLDEQCDLAFPSGATACDFGPVSSYNSHILVITPHTWKKSMCLSWHIVFLFLFLLLPKSILVIFNDVLV